MAVDVNGVRSAVFATSGAKYMGAWKDNLKDGFGVLEQSNGLVYRGLWKQGRRHGSGSLLRKTEQGVMTIYEGEYQDGLKHGEGTKFYHQGVYCGQWARDARTFGMIEFTNGDVYMGEWRNDKFGGVGVYLYANGQRYEGEWSDGKKHGEGVFYHTTTGQVQKGVWLSGVCQTSVIQDADRHQTIAPTKHCIPNLQLTNPTPVVCHRFTEFIRNHQTANKSSNVRS